MRQSYLLFILLFLFSVLSGCGHWAKNYDMQTRADLYNPASIDKLAAALHDDRNKVVIDAMRYLSHFGQQASSAAQDLAEVTFLSEDRHLWHFGKGALITIGFTPDQVIPSATKALAIDDDNTRKNMLDFYLATMAGNPAYDALIPSIEKLVNHERGTIQRRSRQIVADYKARIASDQSFQKIDGDLVFTVTPVPLYFTGVRTINITRYKILPIDLTVTNNGDQPVDIFIGAFQIIDEYGRKVELLTASDVIGTLSKAYTSLKAMRYNRQVNNAVNAQSLQDETVQPGETLRKKIYCRQLDKELHPEQWQISFIKPIELAASPI